MSRSIIAELPPPGGARPAPVAPNDRRRLHGSIAHDIAVGIIGGTYPPGSFLPTEDEFSQKLAVSRTAYREAIRILCAKGLVESRPKLGTRITERSKWNLIDPDVLAWHFEIEPTQAYLDQLFELRLMLEPKAAGLAAERRSDSDITRMREALERMERLTLNCAEGQQADLDFHHAIMVAAGNEALTSLSPSIAATIRWSTLLKVNQQGARMRDPLPDHRLVFEAIKHGDATAAQAQMDHLVRLAHTDMQRR